MSSLARLVLGRGDALRAMLDLVSSHDLEVARLPSEIGLLAVKAAGVLGKTCCIEVTGCPWDALRHYGNRNAWLYAPLAFWRMRRAIRDADHVAYVTGAFLQRRYPTRADNVAAASDVELEAPDPLVLQRRLARLSDRAGQRIRLSVIGRMQDRSKGLQVLLNALAISRADLPALSVSVLEWLDGIDVYLQPSLQEGLPRALIEAMSRGCPALGSTAGGIPELLPAVDLVRPGDAIGLGRLMVRRLKDQQWVLVRAQRNWLRALDFVPGRLAAHRSQFWRNVYVAAGGPRCAGPKSGYS